VLFFPGLSMLNGLGSASWANPIEHALTQYLINARGWGWFWIMLTKVAILAWLGCAGARRHW